MIKTCLHNCLGLALLGWQGVAWAAAEAGNVATTAATAAATASASITHASAIPFRREAVADAADVSRFGVAMLICLALLALALYLLRRHLNLRPLNALQKDAATHLQVLQSQRLGPQVQLHVVQFGQRTLLLSSNAQGVVSVLSVLSVHSAVDGEEALKNGPLDEVKLESTHAQA